MNAKPSWYDEVVNVIAWYRAHRPGEMLVPQTRARVSEAIVQALVLGTPLPAYGDYVRDTLKFQLADPLADEVLDRVVDEGIESLDDIAFARLVLDPEALRYVSDEIDARQPPVWSAAVTRAGERLLRDKGYTPEGLRDLLTATSETPVPEWPEAFAGALHLTGVLGLGPQQPLGKPRLNFERPTRDCTFHTGNAERVAQEEPVAGCEVEWDAATGTLSVIVRGVLGPGPGFEMVRASWRSGGAERATAQLPREQVGVLVLSSPDGRPPQPGDELEVRSLCQFGDEPGWDVSTVFTFPGRG
jgi:hypothetical protein